MLELFLYCSYGGVHPRLYDAIVNYIREGIFPEFCILRSNVDTNAYFHWKYVYVSLCYIISSFLNMIYPGIAVRGSD